MPVLKNIGQNGLWKNIILTLWNVCNNFEEDAYQAAEEGEYPKGYSAKSYTYKDGSVIQFNGGGMSIAYSNQ